MGSLYGVAILGGIGFTMSLFIGTLAFADDGVLTQIRVGVLAGSILAGAVAALDFGSARAGGERRSARNVPRGNPCLCQLTQRSVPLTGLSSRMRLVGMLA